MKKIIELICDGMSAVADFLVDIIFRIYTFRMSKNMAEWIKMSMFWLFVLMLILWILVYNKY